MKCEQVEAIVFDLGLYGGTDSLERAAAMAHLSHCSRCAGLQESWEAAREELRSLSEETLEARAPARVEMRLRQEFRAKHRARAVRRGAVATAWAMAAAAVLVGAVSLWNWEQARRQEANLSARNTATTSESLVAQNRGFDTVSNAIPSGDGSGDFTALPGVTPDETEDAAIMRVRMPRSSLGALGLPVNEERAGEWIQVDLLVGNDGLPQAVRLAQEEN